MTRQKIRIVVDRDIPFLEGVLEPFAEVDYRKGAEIDAAALKQASALLVRTRTRCDAGLLEGSAVRFVGSATIGADHVDRAALERLGIAFANVPGCNSGGVLQYVFTALYGLVVRGTRVLKPSPQGQWAQGKTFGVIGVGHVGSKVARLARFLGYRVLLCDPPRERAEYAGRSDSPFVPLACLLSQSDVVAVHVPLDESTRGMIGTDFLSVMRPGAILINASRGEVADGKALVRACRQGCLGGLVLDVWPHEPELDRELLACADVATPHIAGYSLEGKINGTNGVVRALAGHFGWEALLNFDAATQWGDKPVCPWSARDLSGLDNAALAARLESVFDLPQISRNLKQQPEDFERFRSEFYFRPEFSFDIQEKEL